MKTSLQGAKCVAVQSSLAAFACLLDTGGVVAYGAERFGGDASKVQHELHDIVAIQATHRAFAALRADGSVICWGDQAFGGSGLPNLAPRVPVPPAVGRPTRPTLGYRIVKTGQVAVRLSLRSRAFRKGFRAFGMPKWASAASTSWI